MNDPFRLDGRLALITGSSAGIGLALARALGEAGAALVLNGRDPAKLEAAAQGLRADGFTTHTMPFDVVLAAAVTQAVQAIETNIGPIDILVNNAGLTRRMPLQDFSQEDWNQIMRTNVDGVFFTGQAVARHMIGRQRGKIINICSVQSEMGRPGTAPYFASKGAVKNLTKGMAVDWAPHGLNVNGIGPGYFKTELTEKLVNDPQFNSWLINHTPARRWGELKDLGGAAVFLASEASDFVNGHILYVDGGILATL
jgi:gluconate 5-dehydrogenase